MRTNRNIRTAGRRVLRLLTAIAIVLTGFSCESIYDDQSDCPRGVSIRYRYDYNMLFADAFASHVDCVTCYVFDAEGNYLTEYTEEGKPLADENYRMSFPLGPGHYTLIAYGGLACDKSSFDVTPFTPASHYTDLSVRLRTGEGLHSSAALHGLYYGTVEVDILPDDYKEITIPMMQDTNNIRIALQELNGDSVDIDEFEISITDDNSLLDWQNRTVSVGDVTYTPWYTGTAVAGESAEEDDTPGSEIRVGVAELSTSRLMASHKARLRIHARGNVFDAVDIPLIDYLLIVKSELYSKMPAQEFLDRQSEWSLLFILANGRWVGVEIRILDWTVRINNAKL
ncbi:FimB/Mfa2 family fimbrial subunit [uncultured Bacteroides sp.]|uniref:FimB/Mfa2 family fimbrial subunit n=1 Tax=uncultured Bacteroides sp. TaxID=162156 RepID=UPI0026029D22|nr:FimB/Mfa2 family fimbrial subunit [uncultured Bacteroides sp.]